MGKTKRKYSQESILFQKKIKKPLLDIASVMPFGFSEDLFYTEFKKLYSYLWDDIVERSNEYRRRDHSLIKKGFQKRYFFPSPNEYLKEIAKNRIKITRVVHESSSIIPDTENQKLSRERLSFECNKRIVKRENKKTGNLRYIQLMTPEQNNYYIKTYFKIKKSAPIDIDKRYAVLQEASKYKSVATIEFLNRVNASERNFHLRHFAFTTLQKFGEGEVRLRKNRKGKKHAGDLLMPKKIETPTELVNYIYNSQLEQIKSYDLFLSHSSLDSEILLEIKDILNAANVDIYIDWVGDRDSLKRELTNVNTAKVIIERLKSSKALMYIHTAASSNSKWTPWEIGYFHALKDKVCIYIQDDAQKIPPYLEIYPTALLKNGIFTILDKGKEYSINNWIKE